jgi:hypothetical protein
MSLLQKLSTSTKFLLGIGFILVAYGYLSRAVNLYFFWESRFIGWMVILIGLISLLVNLIRHKRRLNKKAIPEKIGIGLIALFLLIQTIVLIVLPNTDAYAAAKKFIQSNERIKTQLGNIRSFSVVPVGTISVSSGQEGSIGNATLIIIVKGEKKFSEYKVDLIKEINSEWTVYNIE